MAFDLGMIAPQQTTQRAWLGGVLAGLTALLGWVSLGIECHRSIADALAHGHRLPEATYLFLRFFTILSNLGVAVLMSVTCARLLARRAPPPAQFFNAGLVYMLVTCVTYEVILRSRWSPHGMQFLTDFAIHDIIPALVLIFWLGFAPREGTHWRDALWMLAFPAAYFTMTLFAGALGEGYPYNFFDVDALGLLRVFEVGMMFLAVFYALGMLTTGLSIAWARQD